MTGGRWPNRTHAPADRCCHMTHHIALVSRRITRCTCAAAAVGGASDATFRLLAQAALAPQNFPRPPATMCLLGGASVQTRIALLEYRSDSWIQISERREGPYNPRCQNHTGRFVILAENPDQLCGRLLGS